MTTPPSLPSSPGLAWSRHKRPGFATRVASHVSGREVRVALMANPLYEFEAVYNGLTSATSPAAAQAGLGSSSLQKLMGFFLQLQGQFATFLYTDPDDNAVSGQAIGIGDGTTQSFVMSRALGGWNEPVSWVTGISNIYFNGVVQPSSLWTFTAPNSLGFYTAPSTGVGISADFTYAFQCRFLEDQIDFEEFMSALWKLDSMKFRSVKANTTPAAPPLWYNLYSIGGTLPSLFADFTTEGGLDHYLYDGNTYAGSAAWFSALGGTFTRSSPASYTNSSGLLASASSNVPRFDYDPIALTSRGLLREGVSTNICLQSNNFASGGAAWYDANSGSHGYSDVVIGTATTGPDGISGSGIAIADTSANAYHGLQQTVTVSSGATAAFSVWLKQGTLRYASLGFNGSGGGIYATADLLNGTIAATATGNGTLIGYSLVAYPNGWYRAVVSGSISGITTYYPFLVCSQNPSPGIGPYAGSGSYFYAFGAQLEPLGFASSYIPTTSSSATRAADSLSFSPISAWYDAGASTLFANAETHDPADANRVIVSITDSAGHNGLSLNSSIVPGDYLGLVEAGSSDEFQPTIGSAGQTACVVDTSAPAAISASASGAVCMKNAATAATMGTLTMPASPTQLWLAGSDPLWNMPAYGHIRQFGYWPIAATTAQLQALTR